MKKKLEGEGKRKKKEQGERERKISTDEARTRALSLVKTALLPALNVRLLLRELIVAMAIKKMPYLIPCNTLTNQIAI